MKRVIVKDTQGIQTHSAELEDPASWINEQIASNGWGLPERELPAEQCSDSDIASALSSRVQDNGDGTGTTFYTLPAQYTVTITDVTQEYNQKALDSYSEQRITQADLDISVLLGGITDRRALMAALYNLCVVVNPLGNFTESDIATAKTQIQYFLGIMAQVQSIFIQRDADIEAQKQSLGL